MRVVRISFFDKCKFWPVEVSFVTCDEYCGEGHAICFAWFDSELYRTVVLISGSCFTSLLSIIQNNPKKTRCQEAELKIDLPSLPPYIHYIIVESRWVSPKGNETVWVLVVVSFLRNKDAAILIYISHSELLRTCDSYNIIWRRWRWRHYLHHFCSSNIHNIAPYTKNFQNISWKCLFGCI